MCPLMVGFRAQYSPKDRVVQVVSKITHQSHPQLSIEGGAQIRGPSPENRGGSLGWDRSQGPKDHRDLVIQVCFLGLGLLG